MNVFPHQIGTNTITTNNVPPHQINSVSLRWLHRIRCMADQGTATDRKSPLHQAVSVSSATQEVAKTQKADAAPAVAAAIVEEGRTKDAVDEDIYKPPHLTYFQVFILFVKFGE